MCVVHKYHQKRWIEHGRTEEIRNVHNPDFVTPLEMDLHFEARQPLIFEIYDIDSKNPELKDHDFLGAARNTLANLVTKRKVRLFLYERQK